MSKPERTQGRPPEMALCPRARPDCEGWGARPARAGRRLAVDEAELRHLDDDEGGDAGGDSGDRGQNGAPARHSVFGPDAAIELGFDRSALAFENGDHLPTRFEDQRVEGLFEARL